MRLQLSCDCPLSPRNRFSNCAVFPRGGEGQGEGEFYVCSSASFDNKPVNPLIRPPATFSPDLGGEGTCEQLPLMASILNAYDLRLNSCRAAKILMRRFEEAILGGRNGASVLV